MRIGSRWRAGEPMPAGLPTAFAAALAEAETPEGWWTITWLEGRPVAERESGARLALGPDGEVRGGDDATLDPALADEDDDWLV